MCRLRLAAKVICSAIDMGQYLPHLYIDFDAFFASVERQLHGVPPHVPLGVVSFDSDYASMIAVCYAAKRLGIKRGARVNEAREICPALRVFPARHDVYVRLHHRIRALVHDIVPVMKACSIDELSCNTKGIADVDLPALEARLRAAIRAEFGEFITPSIGISCTPLLAKIAAEMDKPSGFVTLHPHDLPGRLLGLELSDIPGIAKGYLKRLNAAKIETVEQLWNLQPKHARAIWRSVEGERLWAELHGQEVIRDRVKKSMFSHGRILSREWQRPEKAAECLYLLTNKAARRARASGLYVSKVTASVRMDKARPSMTAACPPSRDNLTIFRAARAAYSAICAAHPHKRMRSVSICLHGLKTYAHSGGDLFDRAGDITARKHLDRLFVDIDILNTLYGPDTVTLGIIPDLPGGYAGAKIAFGRIPDAKDFGVEFGEDSAMEAA